MRALTVLTLLIAVLTACTTMYSATNTPTLASWDGKGRDISELIAALGPYDTTSVKGDWRSYDWFRFGNCHLLARTSLEDKIQHVTLEGIGTGCNVYLERLGKS